MGANASTGVALISWAKRRDSEHLALLQLHELSQPPRGPAVRPCWCGLAIPLSEISTRSTGADRHYGSRLSLHRDHREGARVQRWLAQWRPDVVVRCKRAGSTVCRVIKSLAISPPPCDASLFATWRAGPDQLSPLHASICSPTLGDGSSGPHAAQVSPLLHALQARVTKTLFRYTLAGVPLWIL